MSACQIVKYGTDYGSFWLPINLNDYMTSESIIYSFGAGEDISFDCLVSGKLKCHIHIFDPTPRAKIHFENVQNVLKSNIELEYDKKIGGGDPNYWKFVIKNETQAENLHFYDFGINTENGTVKFYQPLNPEYVSCSLLPLHRSNNYFTVEVKTLKTIMRELGHDHIDLIKLDIENIECDVIDQMIDNNIFPKFVCVDFDYARTGPVGYHRVMNLINRMSQFNYQILKNDSFDVTFMKKDNTKIGGI